MRRTVIATVVLLVATLVAGLSSADAQMTQTGLEFLKACEGKGNNEVDGMVLQVACAVYLGGWVDAYRVFSGAQPRLKVICLPAQGLPNEQYAMIFTKWLRDHPEELHHSPRVLVLVALKEAFPC